MGIHKIMEAIDDLTRGIQVERWDHRLMEWGGESRR
jgi:hypothetical protein